MKTLIVAFAAAATLLAGTAIAQDQHRIPYGDLDLSSAADAAAFDRRVRQSSRQACRNGSSIDAMVCTRRFRDEAMRQLPAPSREDYARSRRGGRVLAQVPMYVG